MKDFWLYSFLDQYAFYSHYYSYLISKQQFATFCMIKISFVLPIFNEAENIPKLWDELENLRHQIKSRFSRTWQCEFVFVNDGSKDKSLQILKKIQEQNPEEVKVLSFGRNFGHQIAVTAGQDNCTGDAVIIMDTDLQDPPLVCLDLIDKWEQGYDIVYAQRRTYKVPLTKKIPAFLFYRLMARIAQIKIPEDTGDFRLLSKAANDEMRKFKEKNRYLRGISFLTGFKTTSVLFDRSERFAGKPVYTFSKSLKLAIDGITSFSLFPIRIVSVTGTAMAVFGFVFGLVYILVSITRKSNVEGWASLMFAVIFLGGVQLLMLGILGEYIGRIYTEVLNRPLYTITEKYGFKE